MFWYHELSPAGFLAVVPMYVLGNSWNRPPRRGRNPFHKARHVLRETYRMELVKPFIQTGGDGDKENTKPHVSTRHWQRGQEEALQLLKNYCARRGAQQNIIPISFMKGTIL